MTVKLLRLRRILTTTLALIVLGAELGGCYYVMPAYPPPPGGAYVAPGPYVPGRWIWNGYGWVWQPGYLTAPAPSPAGQAPPPRQVAPGAPAPPQQSPPSPPDAPKPQTN